MRLLNVSLRQEKNLLASTSVFLTLLEIDVPGQATLYFVPNPESIVFNGRTYQPFPCKVTSSSQDLRGGLEDIEVTVSNIGREMSAYVELHEMRGSRVRMLTVSSNHLADPTAILEDVTFEINEISVQEDVVTFRLGHDRLLQQRFPAQRFLRNNCRWIYKSAECGYVGALADCSKILEGTNGCRAHLNVSRFGGFPGLPSVGGRLT